MTNSTRLASVLYLGSALAIGVFAGSLNLPHYSRLEARGASFGAEAAPHRHERGAALPYVVAPRRLAVRPPARQVTSRARRGVVGAAAVALPPDRGSDRCPEPGRVLRRGVRMRAQRRPA